MYLAPQGRRDGAALINNQINQLAQIRWEGKKWVKAIIERA